MFSLLPPAPIAPHYNTNFEAFITKSFETLHPCTPFLPNWHITAIAAMLDEVAKGNVKRLLITMPPRSLKSIIVNVAWNAWLLGHNPSHKIISASYSQLLSNKHALDVKHIIQSEWFKHSFPNFAISRAQNDKRKFVTMQLGSRLATSVGGSITGEGGHTLILDDPHNPAHIHSPKRRLKVIEWYQETFASRLDNKKEGTIIIIMQRLHHEDLAGYLLKKGGWEHLNFPAISPTHQCYNIGNFTYERSIGDILHREREGEVELDRARLELGEYGFNAQYQQQPLAELNAIIKLEWLQYYTEPPPRAECQIICSWDTAVKTDLKNDYSVCTIWAIHEEKYYLLEVIRKRLTFPELKQLLYQIIREWVPEMTLIEDHVSGQALIQELAYLNDFPTLAIRPVGNKALRLAIVSSFFAEHKICLPSHKLWLADFINELCLFPHVTHDDQVDSCTQFLQWVAKYIKLNPLIKQV